MDGKPASPALHPRLEDEIAAARLAARRILELSRQMTHPMDGVRALVAFSSHLARIAGLIRTHHLLTGGCDNASQLITESIPAIARESNLL